MLIELLLNDHFWSNWWLPLSPASRLFVISLISVGINALYLAAQVQVRLHSPRAAQNVVSFQNSLALLSSRSRNLRQATVAMFYIFGFLFFLQIQGAFWTPDSSRPVGAIVLENLRSSFRFGKVVFLIFLVLHIVQWLVSSRIRAAALQLRPKVYE